jgi:hypothetical protein
MLGGVERCCSGGDARFFWERRFSIALRAHLAEKLIRQRLDKPSAEEIQLRVSKYLHWRLEESLRVLALDPEPLGELLVEILELVNGEEQIIGWQPPTI